MNRIITRGLGPSHLLVTRGYGVSGITKVYREILRLTSKITMAMGIASPFRKRCD